MSNTGLRSTQGVLEAVGVWRKAGFPPVGKSVFIYGIKEVVACEARSYLFSLDAGLHSTRSVLEAVGFCRKASFPTMGKSELNIVEQTR